MKKKTLDEYLKKFDNPSYNLPLKIASDFVPFFNKGNKEDAPIFRLVLRENGFNYLIPLEGWDLINNNYDLTINKQSQGGFLFTKLKENTRDPSEVEFYNVFLKGKHHVFSEISNLTNTKIQRINDYERNKINEFNDNGYESKKFRDIFENTYIDSIFEFIDGFVEDVADFFTLGKYSQFYQSILDGQLIKTIGWRLIEQASEKCAKNLREHEETYENRNPEIVGQLEETATFYSNLNYNAHYAVQRNHYFYNDLKENYSRKSNKIIERNFNRVKENIEKKAELFL